MTAALTALMSLISGVLPLLTSSANSATIGSIITTLEGFLPYIIQEIKTLYTPVKNIIAALGANPATNATQAASLATLDAQMDAAFEAAASDTDAGI